MIKPFFIFLLIIGAYSANAQQNDSLFAVRKGENWAIKYVLKANENLPMLARRFHVSELAMQAANEFINKKKLPTGTIVFIPVTLENYFVTKQPLDITNIQELYYHVAPKDDIALLSTTAGITKIEMRKWNGLRGNTLKEGQTLFIGWVKMVSFDATNPNNELSYPSGTKMLGTDTVRSTVLGGLDTVYKLQTNNGADVLTEKGTAAFFEKAGKNNIYYAFHNTTKRGTIIKVFNPGTRKTIFVKVLGPIPDTRLFAGSVIGITSAAKEALGITDSKAWCELSYSASN